MKRITTVLLIITILCGVFIYPVDANTEYMKLSEFDDSGLSMWFLWLPINSNDCLTYKEQLKTEPARTLHEMFIPFDIGVTDDNEREYALNKYGLNSEVSEYCKIYHTDEVQQTFNAAYNTDIDMQALDGMKFEGMDFIYVRDNYFIVNLYPHGGERLPCAKSGIKLNTNSEYWIWYYGGEWDSPNLIYSIVSYKNVAGYNMKTIDYLEYVPPGDGLLSEYQSEDLCIRVTLNGVEIPFDQPPIMYNDRTLVPLRAICEALGATVYWNDDTQTVTAEKGDITIKFTIGAYEFYKNGFSILLDVPGMIVNGRTLVPIRAISEALNCTVEWDDRTETVYILYNENNESVENDYVIDTLFQYAKNNLKTLCQDEHDEQQQLYTDVRFKFADVSDDGQAELLAVGIRDNELCYLEIYQYQNGNIVNIFKHSVNGYAYGHAMGLVWYDGRVRTTYSSGSSGTGFLNCLMRYDYDNGDWVDIYNTYQDIDYSNNAEFKGYVINGEYVSEEEFNTLRDNIFSNSLTINDFTDLANLSSANGSPSISN